MTLIVPSIRNEKIKIYLNENTVYFDGTIDMQYPHETVGLFFKTLHQEILSHESKLIIIDICRLLFINSSGIREFLAWLLSVISLPKTDKYEIFLIINPEISYQTSLAKSFLMLYPTIKLMNSQKNIISVRNL